MANSSSKFLIYIKILNIFKFMIHLIPSKRSNLLKKISGNFLTGLYVSVYVDICLQR